MIEQQIETVRLAYAAARAVVEHLEEVHSPAQGEARNSMYELQDQLRDNDPDFVETMREHARLADEQFADAMNAMSA